jgi:hypothetical protein
VSRTARSRPSAATPRRILTWVTGLSLEARLLIVVCVVALLLRLWPIAGGSTEYDEGVYWESLRAMASGHPLYSSVFSSQPPAFLLGLYPFYWLFGQSLVASRLGIVVYSLVGIVAIYFAGRAIGGRWVGLAAAVVLTADPLYLTMSHTLEAEMPALAWEIICVALAAEAMRQHGSRRNILAAASGIALGLGVLSKLLDVVAVVPAVLYLSQPLWDAALDPKGQLHLPERPMLAERWQFVWPALALYFAAAVGVTVLMLLPFAGNLGAVYDQAVRFHLAAAPALHRGPRYNLTLMLQLTAYVPISAVIGLVGILLVYTNRAWRVLPPLAWLLASFVVLVRQQPLFDHHLVSLAPPLALSMAVVIVTAVGTAADPVAVPPSATLASARWRLSSPLVLIALLAAMLALSLTLTIPNDQAAAQPNQLVQREMAAALRATSLPQDDVVSDDQFLAGLADRAVPPQLVDTSEVRIKAGYLTATQLEAIVTATDTRYVLFATGRFDEVPGFRAWVDQHFARAADFGDGRALYIKKPVESGPIPA